MNDEFAGSANTQQRSKSDDKSQQQSQNQQNGQTTDLNKLQADLDAANKNIADLTDTAKRALADLQNYRRRVEEERVQFVQFAGVTILSQLLPIADNFQRAFAHAPQDMQKTEWFKGVVQIEQQLIGLLQKQGVTQMPSTVGQPLDPLKHEAISVGPGEKEIVIEEFEKGYMLGDKVLRPAKVKVGIGV